MTSLQQALPPPPVTPARCPFCRSMTITTGSEKVDASTYWRCQTCGQMWNVERLRASRY